MILARTIRIYALAAAGSFFHLILAYEAPIPSSNLDLRNTKVAYCAILGLLMKLEATKMRLVDLNNERVELLCTGIKRKGPPMSSPPITGTPIAKKAFKKKEETENELQS
jgi:hypothetical protein